MRMSTVHGGTHTLSTLLRTVIAAPAGLILVLASGCSAPSDPGTVITEPGALAARGEYLTAAIGCHDCHTPWTMTEKGPAPDMSRALSGHPEDLVMPPIELPPGPWIWAGAGTNTAFAGPWGVSFATNLTPDMETGLGIYTEESFVAALKTGRHMGAGRPILPPMPWPAYAHLTDDDLKAIYAHLSTLPPTRNRVPAAIIAAPPAP